MLGGRGRNYILMGEDRQPARRSTRRAFLWGAGGLAVGAAAGAGAFGILARRKPNIVFIISDALRADSIGRRAVTGRSLTPFLDSAAGGGALFENCLSPSSWTLPSVAGTVSSRNPIVTGRYYNESYAAGATTFAAELGKKGYFTAAVVKNPWLPARDARGGLLPTIVRYGFDHYDVGGAKLEDNPFFAGGIGAPRELVSFAPAESASAEALDVLKAARTQGKRGPFCLYIHYMNTHQPYSPAARHLPIADAAAPRVEGIPDHLIYQVFFSRANERDFAAPVPAEDVPLVERGRALYDAATASVDEAVEALSEGLRKAGELSNTVFLFTSDHGEEFAERGRCGHSVTLYQESIRVPLIVWGAGVQRGVRVSSLVSGVDMAPEILAAAGCEPLEDFEGAGLGLFAQGAAAEAVGCTVAPTLPGELETLTMSLVRSDGVKLILKGGAGGAKGDRTEELYDLNSDPGERRNLASEGAETAALSARLDRYFAAAAARPAMRRLSVDDETRELLRSLGYAN